MAPHHGSGGSSARIFFRKNDFVWEKKEIDSQAPKFCPVLHFFFGHGRFGPPAPRPAHLRPPPTTAPTSPSPCAYPARPATATSPSPRAWRAPGWPPPPIIGAAAATSLSPWAYPVDTYPIYTYPGGEEKMLPPLSRLELRYPAYIIQPAYPIYKADRNNILNIYNKAYI